MICLTIAASGRRSFGAKMELFLKSGQSGLAQFPLFTPGYVQSDPISPNFTQFHLTQFQPANPFWPASGPHTCEPQRENLLRKPVIFLRVGLMINMADDGPLSLVITRQSSPGDVQDRTLRASSRD